MRVTFLLPFVNHRGGTQLIMELSDRLAAAGDQVTVVWPTRLKPLPTPLNEIEWAWRAPFKMLARKWWTTRATVRAVPTLAERYVPDGDVVVATAWHTASWAASYGPSRGRKVYYVFEPEVHHDPEACAATYRLPFERRLAISEWTRAELERRFGQRLDAVTPLGLDLARFPARSAPPRPHADRVGMVYDPAPKKGFEEGYAAFRAVRERHPGLRLHLLGVPRRAPRFPAFVSTHFHVAHEEKVRLFHATDVWLASSREEGWGLTPMEAMACGAAVVTTRVGGTPYFARDGETALVVEPRDGSGLEAALERILSDDGLRLRLVDAGVRFARELTMDETARAFREAVAPLAPSERVACERAPG